MPEEKIINNKENQGKVVRVGASTMRMNQDSSVLKELIEENLALTKEIHEISKKMNSHMIWERVFGILKLLIIIVPIVLGVIYLPSLLSGLFEAYKPLFEGSGIDLNSIDLNSISPDLIKKLTQ